MKQILKVPIIEREFLQNLCETANAMCEGNLNPKWVRVYRSLADAADRLDAMTARTEETTVGGWGRRYANQPY